MNRPSLLETVVPLLGRLPAIDRLRDPATRARVKPWLAVAALWVLFDLPSVFQPRGLSFKHFRPSADVLALLTLAGASYAFSWGVWLRRALSLGLAALVVYRIDEGVFGLLMHAKPLLYDQLFLLRHLMVLVSDLFSFKTILVVGGGVLFVALAIWAATRLVRVAKPLVAPERIASTGRAVYVLWLVLLVLSGVSEILRLERPLVRWIAPDLVENLATSRATYKSLARNLKKTPYAEFDKIVLTRKPNVKLMLIESYGKLLVNAKPTRASYRQQMQLMQQRLTADGWHMVSAYSRASVSGGRSWLAEASLLMGTNVSHESVFRHLAANMKAVPTLVSFLGKQGYYRVQVGPPDRERPGVRVSSPYPFDQFVLFNDLKYKGSAYGWGIVPDQYSLGFVENEVLPRVQDRPLFLDFHFVTSHAPWNPLPPYVSDYHQLNAMESQHVKPYEADKYALENLLRYERRRVPEYNYMGKLDGVLLARYEQAIYYELDLIEEHLKKSQGDDFVIVMGDHQPPVIASDKVSFDVPVHVFSRDRGMLEPLRQLGFVNGLVLSPVAPALTSHAGLFSLVVRTLRMRGGKGPVPPFRSEGHELVQL
jgi:hypothetical protein